MSKLNTKTDNSHIQTHEGAPAWPHTTPLQQLRRSVLACLLWENTFYEDGVAIGERIEEEAKQVSTQDLADLAIEARNRYKLRHVPLLLLVALAKRGGAKIVSETIAQVIQRPDEMPEFLAIYWRNGRTPLSAQVKKGLAKAFTKFNGYQLAKYNRDSAIKLRDVLFLVHAKPVDKAQETIWTQLIDGTLPAPDTWEVGLSRGDDKAETFTRLLQEEKLGYLALLRNLRNMMDVGVDTALVEEKIITHKGRTKALPFRFVAAARACPQLEPALDQALQANIEGSAPLPGKTVVLVDVSYSMTGALSARSDLTRMDAACALAGIINGDIRMFSFSNDVVEVPPRRGMAAVDALKQSQEWSGTNLALAVDHINDKVPCDRLIVITDEQSTSWGRKTPDPKMDRAYMINVASYKNGVGYGKWAHIDGFSEAVLSWIHAFESEGYE